MNDFQKFLSALVKWRLSILIQAFIVMAIASICALIRIAIFGASDGSLLESTIVLIGSVILSDIIIKKISGNKK